MYIFILNQNYFGDAWNVFDFIIVLGSFIDIVYSEVNVSFLTIPCIYFLSSYSIFANISLSTP